MPNPHPAEAVEIVAQMLWAETHEFLPWVNRTGSVECDRILRLAAAVLTKIGYTGRALDAAAVVDWMKDNDFRLSQVQGFQYGEKENWRLVVKDCSLNDQVIWERPTTGETYNADHAELTRQIAIYRMSLAFKAISSTDLHAEAARQPAVIALVRALRAVMATYIVAGATDAAGEPAIEQMARDALSGFEGVGE